MPLNDAWDYVFTNVGGAAQAAPAAPREPQRGPHTPNSIWIEETEGGRDLLIKRADAYGNSYAWMYIYPDEVKQLAPVLMEWLVKEGLKPKNE